MIFAVSPAPRAIANIVAVILALSVVAPTHAQVYKCKRGNVIAYQDKPCAKGAQLGRITLETPPVAGKTPSSSVNPPKPAPDYGPAAPAARGAPAAGAGEPGPDAATGAAPEAGAGDFAAPSAVFAGAAPALGAGVPAGAAGVGGFNKPKKNIAPAPSTAPSNATTTP